MRKENYMIALMNKKLLKLRLPPPFPKRRFLTKAVEWGLRLALFDYVFTPVSPSSFISMTFQPHA